MFLGRSLIKLTAPQPDPKMTTRGFCDPLSNFKVCEPFDCVPLTSMTGAATACMHVQPRHPATANVSILCLILYFEYRAGQGRTLAWPDAYTSIDQSMQAAAVGPQQAYREQLQALLTRVASLMTLSKSFDTVMRTTQQRPSLLLDQKRRTTTINLGASLYADQLAYRHRSACTGVLFIVSNSGICRLMSNQIFHETQSLQCLDKGLRLCPSSVGFRK